MAQKIQKRGFVSIHRKNRIFLLTYPQAPVDNSFFS